MIKRISTSIVLTFSLFNFSAQAQTDTRVTFINKLLTTSSGAQQINKSSNPEAKALHQDALELYRQAQEETNLGNSAKASALIDQSAKKMFQAIRMATPSSLGNSKLKNDFNKRKESINTLRSAFDRIADENKGCECKEKTNAQITEITTTAEKLMDDGKTVKARTELDKAYQLLKVSIESLRGGQTLVRSLDFATPKEEYHYEIDRNDTHNMLVKLLLEDKKVSDYTSEKVAEFTEAAKSLRTDAEKSALSDKYEDAIKLLEDSTKQLVRAIRSAGIYIPG